MPDQAAHPDPRELTELVASESTDVDLTCDECGAPLAWDPDTDALACGHCGTTRAVERGEGSILERPLADAGDAARGLGLEVRVVRCETCAARVTLDPEATATACAFCGSSSVMHQAENRNALRPESLVPLDVSRADVHAAFRRWVRGRWFRPRELDRVDPARALGIYVPAWTFDARVRSRWTADSGTYYYVMVPQRVYVSGKWQTRMRRERRTRWRPARGARVDVFDDLHVLASTGVDAKLARKLGEWNTRALVPYRAEYLAGWRAEEYQLDLAQAWGVGLERIERRQRQRCAGDVPGDTHRRLRVRNTLSDVRWKHVLLPLWTLHYRYKDKVYAVLIHGQSGKVVGRAPVAWGRILLLLLLVFGGGALLAGVIAALVGGAALFS